MTAWAPTLEDRAAAEEAAAVEALLVANACTLLEVRRITAQAEVDEHVLVAANLTEEWPADVRARVLLAAAEWLLIYEHPHAALRAWRESMTDHYGPAWRP